MDTVLLIFLTWAFVALLLGIGFFYLGPSFVIWVAGGLAFVMLSPIPLPDLSAPAQVLTWAICIILYLSAWFLFIKPGGTKKTEAKSPRGLLIGETGLIIEAPGESGDMMVRFQDPVRGVTDWKIVPLEDLMKGDRVVVVDLVGKSLVVKKPEPNW